MFNYLQNRRLAESIRPEYPFVSPTLVIKQNKQLSDHTKTLLYDVEPQLHCVCLWLTVQLSRDSTDTNETTLILTLHKLNF